MTENNLHKKLGFVLSEVFLFSVIILFNSSCAGTGEGFKELEFKDDIHKDIRIYGMFDKDFASKNFGGFRFIFENKRDQWSTIENVQLSFVEDSAKKYIKPLDQRGLKLWGKAILQQKHIKGSDFNQIQSALLKAGSSITGIIIDEGNLDAMASGNSKKKYPDNHLYSEEFVLPPNFALEKWILFESSHHQNIPYATNVQLEFDINERQKHADLQFRKKSSRYKNFIWFDPTRKQSLNFYLGISVGSAFPMGEFSDRANKQDYILNSFGISSYITLLTNLGLSFSLDYQSFQARAKLPAEADSLLLLNTDFEFSSWQNIGLFISPRFVLPLNLKLDLFAELTAGVAMCLTPTIISRRFGLETGEFKGKSSISLAGGFAVGARFYLSSKMSLDIKGEYMPFLEPTFTYETVDYGEIKIKQDMSQFKVKASLFWDL